MSRRIVRQQSLLAAVPYLLRHQQVRWAHDPSPRSPFPRSPFPRGPFTRGPPTRGPPTRGPPPRGPSLPNKKTEGKSEWWTVDGEMHEVGEHVPHRERFVIPRDNLPNKRRKQMREQFMRSTRLVLKDTEHEPWCKKYMELYQELRENWERLYWDEGYSKKIAQDHANYESAEDDDLDFSPYRRRQSHAEIKEEGHSNSEISQRIHQVRDRFEYERERRITDRAFAPMNMTNTPPYSPNPNSNSRPHRSGAKFFPQTFRGYK